MSAPQLDQSMRQSLVMGASMQLFLRVLQSTHTELTQIVNQALNANPTLEEAPPSSLSEGENRTPDFEATHRHDLLIDSLPQQLTLCAHLEQQALQSALPSKTEAAVLELIAHLDHRGFFTEAPESLGLQPALLHEALQVVQDLEPAGVGARDLRESLLLQLRREGLGEDALPVQLVRNHWEALIRHRYAEAAHAMGVSEQKAAAAAHHISRLNPDPGSDFARQESIINVPDITVQRQGDELIVALTNEMVPHLALSPQYREMLAEHADKQELRHYLSQRFREGRELIQAIEKRQSTILQTARAIVERQRLFFLRGPAHLAPLRMEDIAADTGLHVSTISRAVNGKFLRCEHGVYELRSFFGAALSAAEGESVSAGRIRARIRALIAAEDPRKPLSDAKLASLLEAEGFHIARRTIAKYRDQLKLLPASLRKQ